MGVRVVGEVIMQPSRMAEFQAFLEEVLPDTRTYDGCDRVEIFEDEDKEGTILFVEHWASRAHQEKYVAWRTETGAMGKLGDMLDGAVSVRYFRNTGM